MPRFYFHFRDAKLIRDDSGEELPDIDAAGGHARRMATELSDEVRGSNAAIIVSDGQQDLFEISLSDCIPTAHSAHSRASGNPGPLASASRSRSPLSK
jgi:hypothetical protein